MESVGINCKSLHIIILFCAAYVVIVECIDYETCSASTLRVSKIVFNITTLGHIPQSHFYCDVSDYWDQTFIWFAVREIHESDIEYIRDDRGKFVTLGRGGEGIIYLVRLKVVDHQNDGFGYITCVMKIIGTDVTLEQIQNELYMLWLLENSDFTPYLFGYVVRPLEGHDAPIGIVMEFVGEVLPEETLYISTSLSHFIDKGPTLDIADWLKLTFYLAKNLEQLHKRGIVHADIKLSNVLLKAGNIRNKWNPYWIDFGHSVMTDNSHSYPIKHRFGSSVRNAHSHIAPEIFNGGYLSKESDIYSFGMLLYDLMVFRDVADLQPIVTMTTSENSSHRPNCVRLVQELEHLINFIQQEQ